jgi:hypothetical protein
MIAVGASLATSSFAYSKNIRLGRDVASDAPPLRAHATGENVHAEWVNTRAEIDRRRAAAGIAHYQPGTPYDPRQAIPLLEEAEFFDPTFTPVAAKLANLPGARFATWRLALNAALRD